MRGILAVLTVVLAIPAKAEPITERAARSQLFSPRGSSVEVFPADFLGPVEIKALEGYAAEFDYYAAFAVSPGDPAENGSAVGLANYHSENAARNAALGACNARRKTGRPCIIVAVTRPRGWKPRGFQLSVGATTGFRTEYRKLKAPKAMAISPKTGAWAVGRGDGGRVLASCNRRAADKGSQDCRIAIVDK